MTNKRFGGFWRRFWAWCIDEILLYLISLMLYLLGRLALGLGRVSLGGSFALGGLPEGMGRLMPLYTAFTLITAMVYFTWFHGSFGRTPGKRLLGLRVVQVSGDPMTLGVAFLRWVGTLVSGLVLGLGYLWVAFDGRKQGWHDKLAATLVVRTKNGYAAAAPPESPAGPPAPSMAAPAAMTMANPGESAESGAAPPDLPGQEAEPADGAKNQADLLPR
ncbi:MAG: RDD family protein [Deltaproteobacteria bacterium]|nr:RDD family protein [Deltaproteobacteria bacterium]